MRAKYIAIGVVLGVLLSSAVVVLAGNLDPPSGPRDPASQMYTLEQIYQRLNTGAKAGLMESFTEPDSGPGIETMHTLNDIMTIAPEADDTNGAVPDQVLGGKTYWGLRTDGTWGPQTGSAFPVSLPRTGQTNCYTAAEPWSSCTCGSKDCPPGQDGELLKGVAWPNPRFTDNGNGTVTDNLTGLIWLKAADCTTFFTGDSAVQNERPWGHALSAASLLASGHCGLTDGSSAGQWRLPNVRELHSLIHFGFLAPALPDSAGTGWWTEGDPFTGFLYTRYWSSTNVQVYLADAWYVDFYFGSVDFTDKVGEWRVWPVREGP